MKCKIRLAEARYLLVGNRVVKTMVPYYPWFDNCRIIGEIFLSSTTPTPT